MINLTYSIFYNQNEWHNLIKHIHSSIKEFNDKTLFFVRLSYLKGAHVQFTIMVDENLKLESAKYFSECIKGFIDKNISSNKDVETIIHKQIKDFPNNTIHYGIHDYHNFNLINDNNSIDVHNQVAEIIFLIFEEYQNDTINSMTEIIIQVFVVWCQATSKSIDDLVILFEVLLKNVSIGYSKDFLRKQKKIGFENFQDNKDAILEYLSESLISKSNLPIDGWEKKIYNLTQNSLNCKNNTPDQIMFIVCKNINYKGINAYVMFLEGLKVLRNRI